MFLPDTGEVVLNLVPNVVLFCLTFWFGITKSSEGTATSVSSELKKEYILVFDLLILYCSSFNQLQHQVSALLVRFLTHLNWKLEKTLKKPR